MYLQANVESGCCVSGGNLMYHRRCICEESSDQCQSLCSSDTGCKGYVMFDRGSGATDLCQIATNSTCPISCQGPFSKENIGPIDPNAKCHFNNVNNYWNGGCLIKRGILLH